MDHEHVPDRGIPHQRPEPHLLFVKQLIILRGCRDNGKMIRLIGLDHNLTLPLSASGAPGRLCQELKRAYRRTEITDIQGQIRRQYPDKGHIRKIVSLDDHLRAAQNICLLIRKG